MRTWKSGVMTTMLALLLGLTGTAMAGLVPTPLTGTEANTVLLYKFDEFTGDNALVGPAALVDSSGNGNAGAIGLTRVFTSDLAAPNFDRALRIDTSGTNTPGGTLAASLFKDTFTVEAWFRNASGGNRFFNLRQPGIGWIFEFSGGGLRAHNGSAWTTVLASVTVPSADWTHWAMVFNNTNVGAEDSSYSVDWYVTDPDVHTAPNLIGTFALNPVQTATALAGYRLGYLEDGSGVGGTFAADRQDEIRISTGVTAFEALGIGPPPPPVPEPGSAMMLLFGLAAMLPRKRT
jgi:hypothetical protein